MQSCCARAAAATARGVVRAVPAVATRSQGPRSLLLMSSPGLARGLSSAAPSRRAPPSTAATSTATTTPALRPLPTPTTRNPNWTVRMLYDGECALCMKEVDFLRKRAASSGDKIDFVDIASPDFSAEQNAGIEYETAMAKIHALKPDGQVLTGIAVFRELYEAVGLGWVYGFTANAGVERAANAVYDAWARYRTQITGRKSMDAIFEARRRRLAAVQAGASDLPASECRVDGSGCGDEAGVGK